MGPTGRAVYLDFKDTAPETLKARYGNLFEMYEEITGEDPYQAPMRIFPAAHFSMGGLWVDYHLRTNLPRLFALGESNYSDHGANRLGANSLLQTLVDGLFVAPLTVPDELARLGPLLVPEDVVNETLEKTERDLRGFLENDGTHTPRYYHRRLGEILRDFVGVKRDADGLEKATQALLSLREQFQSNLKVVGSGQSMNNQLEMAGRTRDFLELALLLTRDALAREECCGSHFRADLPFQRNDERYGHVAAWEWTGDVSAPVLHKEKLLFEEIGPSERVY